MKYLLLCFFIGIFVSIKGQELSGFYLKLKKEVNQSPEETVKQGKILHLRAKKLNDLQTASKAEYIAGFAYYLLGNSDSCVYYANSAIATAQSGNYKEGEALGLRLLGTQYAKLGLLYKSQKSLDNALTIIQESKGDEASEIRGMVYSSLLVLMDDSKNLDKKVDVAKKAINSYERIQDNNLRKDRLVSAFTNLGYLYVKVKKYDSANVFFQKALQNTDPENLYMNAAVYHDIGFSFSVQGDYKRSVENFLKALSYTKGSQFASKKIEILSGLSDSYSKIGDSKKSLYYLQMHNKLRDSMNIIERQTVSNIDQQQSIPENQDKQQDLYRRLGAFLGIVILISGIFGFFCYNTWNKSRNNNSPSKISEFNIGKETQEQLLQKLQNFEEQKMFLDKYVSLYSMSNDFHCNTKYLSFVIKNSKGKTFSHYINDLRIQYVLDKLSTDPEFRNFKISYLADCSGFSSHGAFASAFTSYTKEKPSQYIKNGTWNK